MAKDVGLRLRPEEAAAALFALRFVADYSALPPQFIGEDAARARRKLELAIERYGAAE